LLYDEDGNRFTPSHAVKRGKRYRYYVSQKVIEDAASASVQPGRIPAREIEKVVINELKSFFASADQVVSAFADADDDLATTQTLIESVVGYAKRLEGISPSSLSEMLETIVARILVHQGSVEIQIIRAKLRAQLLGPNRANLQSQDTMNDLNHQPIVLTIETRLKRCGGEMRLVIPSSSADQAPDNAVPALIKAISRAHEWVRLIIAGEYKDQRAIAVATGLNERYVSRIISSAFLAPEIVEAIVKGRQAPEMTLASREEGRKEYDRVIQGYETAHPDKAYRDAIVFQGHDQTGHPRNLHRNTPSAPQTGTGEIFIGAGGMTRRFAGKEHPRRQRPEVRIEEPENRQNLTTASGHAG
jgi:hypothetical protein